jgi:hypothetical protein
MVWFLFLTLGGHPIALDMPSEEVCQQVRLANIEYRGACWARKTPDKVKSCVNDDDVCEDGGADERRQHSLRD